MEKGWLDAAPIWTNLKTFPWSSFRGKVDILSGGFPCQPFSNAGKKAGDEDPRHLWPHIKRGIELVRPPIIFMENVEGIINSKLQSDQWSDPKGTSVLLHVLRELERLGYQAAAGIFSAAEVGLPQSRKRVFILGYAKSQHDWRRKHQYISKALQKREREFYDFNASSESSFLSPRAQEQNKFEPPRTINEKIKPKMGGLFDGPSDRLDLSVFYEACESRTDELRSLGNGVVPQTATKAFHTLLKRLL
tara:strand:- start:4457 stop:5200 length:744 start_codon:yes stop_codon:yes gene_type:complete